MPFSGRFRGGMLIPLPATGEEEHMLSFGVTALPDPPYTRLVEVFQNGERNGFDHGWTYDSHILWQESYATAPDRRGADRDDQARPLRHQPRDPRPDDHGELVRDAARRLQRPRRDGHRPRRLLAPGGRPEAGQGGRVRAPAGDDQGADERPPGRVERQGAEARVGARRAARHPDARRRLRAARARGRRPRRRRRDHPARRPADHPVDHGHRAQGRRGGRPRPGRAASASSARRATSPTTSPRRATRCAGSRRWSRTT